MTGQRIRRRAGDVGQIDSQGRSHDAADCGTYRLVRRLGPSRWEVEYIAECDGPDDLGGDRSGVLRFVSRDEYDRYF